jgi:signal transduction histidine kinase
VEQDLVFLAAAARVAARHLERISLLQTVATETLARRRLAELDRLKSEFLAQVAHDLRTPVAGISWSARNLLDGLAGDLNEGQIKYLGSISSSGAHLNRLVDNLLEISRLEDARNQFLNSPFRALEAWREALENLRPLAAEKDVALELRGEELDVTVQGNHDKLVEVTVNLLDNAVKYTKSGTIVTITVHPAEGGFQTIDVRDMGPGLRGQDPQALFGRFAQGEPSPHSSRKGFGLGLHIAATYLEMMGGSLTASDHPDGGAVFACRLPLADSPSAVPDQGDPS